MVAEYGSESKLLVVYMWIRARCCTTCTKDCSICLSSMPSGTCNRPVMCHIEAVTVIDDFGVDVQHGFCLFGPTTAGGACYRRKCAYHKGANIPNLRY